MPTNLFQSNSGPRLLLDQSVQAYGEANDKEGHGDQYQPCFEESSLKIVHALMIALS